VCSVRDGEKRPLTAALFQVDPSLSDVGPSSFDILMQERRRCLYLEEQEEQKINGVSDHGPTTMQKSLKEL